MAEADTPVESLRDKDYRRKSINHMFMGALYSALGMASFFGMMQQIVGMVVKAFSTEAAKAATEVATKAATASAGMLGVTPMGWAIIGGLMAAGAAFTYMAQVEFTKLKEVQDDRLAQKNAEELCRSQDTLTHSQHQTVEYSQNKPRSDGRKWEEVTAKPLQQGHSLGGH